jgi:exodeoxyribonuclease V alpha subunit
MTTDLILNNGTANQAQKQSTTLQLLEYLCNEKVIRPIDLEFGRFIWQQEYQLTTFLNQADRAAKYATLISHYLGQGHVCIRLTELIKKQQRSEPVFIVEANVSTVILSTIQQLEFDPRTELADLQQCCTFSDSADKPLMIEYQSSEARSYDGSNEIANEIANEEVRFYMNRYWHYEAIIAQYVLSAEPFDINESVLSDVLNALFPKGQDVNESSEPDYQKLAAAVALTSSLSVITGGPGTGKTYTVVRLLAALIMVNDRLSSNTNPKTPVIRLAAPTGKAAARMLESIRNALDSLPLTDEQKAAFPDSASTLHRLLGSLPLDANFKHHKKNPLHLDILIVDEASMIDLPMMAKLLDAMPERGRVVLLGDRDQLASVEAGSVLSDLCQRLGNYSPDRAAQLSRLTGYALNSDPQVQTGSIQDALAWLKISRRFGADSGIGALAYAINSGNSNTVMNILSKQSGSSRFDDIQGVELSELDYHQTLNQVAKAYKPYIQSAQQSEYETALSLFNNSRLLCALREGDYGVKGLNESIKLRLEKLNIIATQQHVNNTHGHSVSDWYVGRPVMVLRNDHVLGLYNGDIGIVMKDSQGRLRVYFESSDGLKSVLPSRMPEHETAYAMTVHKSQGSEFKHTVLVLPDRLNPVLTRELIYTGVTRAKEELTLLYDPKVLYDAVQQRVVRHSGLADKLFQRSLF